MINRHLKEFHSEIFDQNQFEKVKLRDEVLLLLSEYCAQLSQSLWIEYNYKIVPQLLNLRWNTNLHFEFLQYKRLIDNQGLSNAGNAIILALKELLKADKQTRNNMH